MMQYGKHINVCWLPNTFLEFSHKATWGNHHMYVGYQIHFSNLSHNATWGNHHVYVGYQIHFSSFLIMQLGKLITCMLVTRSISRICLIMQPGQIITCMLATKSIYRILLIMQPGESSHVCWLPNPFLEFVS